MILSSLKCVLKRSIYVAHGTCVKAKIAGRSHRRRARCYWPTLADGMLRDTGCEGAGECSAERCDAGYGGVLVWKGKVDDMQVVLEMWVVLIEIVAWVVCVFLFLVVIRDTMRGWDAGTWRWIAGGSRLMLRVV
ncbi:hypothetical protein HBH51_071340 [Parastagonospora nodorum]|nr:hypothetical protein HBH51_071340 [Parastagonospora nodorum]